MPVLPVSVRAVSMIPRRSSWIVAEWSRMWSRETSTNRSNASTTLV